MYNASGLLGYRRDTSVMWDDREARKSKGVSERG